MRRLLLDAVTDFSCRLPVRNTRMSVVTEWVFREITLEKREGTEFGMDITLETDGMEVAEVRRGFIGYCCFFCFFHSELECGVCICVIVLWVLTRRLSISLVHLVC